VEVAEAAWVWFCVDTFWLELAVCFEWEHPLIPIVSVSVNKAAPAALQLCPGVRRRIATAAPLFELKRLFFMVITSAACAVTVIVASRRPGLRGLTIRDLVDGVGVVVYQQEHGCGICNTKGSFEAAKLRSSEAGMVEYRRRYASPSFAQNGQEVLGTRGIVEG
jgi:hypothetical protein